MTIRIVIHTGEGMQKLYYFTIPIKNFDIAANISIAFFSLAEVNVASPFIIPTRNTESKSVSILHYLNNCQRVVNTTQHCGFSSQDSV